MTLLTMQDPAVRRTIAKMRWRFRLMKKLGIPRAIDGAVLTPAAKTDVRATWRRHGWRKPARSGR